MNELIELTVADGRATTTSLDVARHFGKRHDDVLKAIRNLLAELTGDHARNFAEMVTTIDIGSGAKRKSPAYRITRDGFTLLAMRFTGRKALAFQLAYIDAFNKMEAELQMQRVLQTPGSWTRMMELDAKDAESKAQASTGSLLMRARKFALAFLRPARQAESARLQLELFETSLPGLRLRHWRSTDEAR